MGGYSGDGAAATSATLYGPSAYITFDVYGNLYYSGGNVIRKITPAGIISTFAGTGVPGYSGDGGAATTATINNSWEITSDLSGNVYFADASNYRVRKIDLSGIITTVAGNGSLGFGGDGVIATSTSVQPASLTVDAMGNLYIGEWTNKRIRKVSPTGIITTIIGDGTYANTGDGGPASAAQIEQPNDLCFDGFGNLFITDFDGSDVVRMVSAAGIITRIAGTGLHPYNGDGIPATTANLWNPRNCKVDDCGNAYISDQSNHRIRKVAYTSTSFAGTIFDPGSATLCVGSNISLSNAVTGGTWTSSNTAVAIIGSSSGVVTGTSPGSATISYTVNRPCGIATSTHTLTVVPSLDPGIITGSGVACAGSAITLSDGVAGGIWTSGNTTVATVSGGIVSALAAGSATISYSVTLSGCTSFATHSLIVSVLSSAGTITGPTTVCEGASASMSDAIAGGVWGSDNTMVATVAGSVITANSAGTVTIFYTVTNVCGSATTTRSLTVNPAPTVFIGNTFVCIGGTANLSNTSTGGIWSSSNTAIATIGSIDGIVTGISQGTSVISYTLTTGCAGIETMSVIPVPIAGAIVGATILCEGAKIVLTDYVQGGVWSSSDPTATVLGGMVTGISPGSSTISYTITNSCGSATISKIVSTLVLPDAGVISGPGSVCKGAVFNLSESVTGGTWSSGNSAVAEINNLTGTITAKTTGSAIITYFVGPNASGCSNTTTLPITILAAPPFIIDGNVVHAKCYGGSDGSITSSVAAGSGVYKYAWSNSDTSISIGGLYSGSYILQVTDISTLCIDSKTFIVNQPDSLLPTVDVKDNICNAGSGSISISLSGGTSPYHYLWSNNTTGSEINGLTAAVYSVTVTDQNGCSKKLTSIVSDTCSDIIIPDVITPNGDGVNDKWVVGGLQKYPGNTVQIFDKWGDVVYEKSNYSDEWNGQGKNGNLLPSGTYFYLIKLNATNVNGGKNSMTGPVLIKR